MCVVVGERQKSAARPGERRTGVRRVCAKSATSVKTVVQGREVLVGCGGESIIALKASHAV